MGDRGSGGAAEWAERYERELGASELAHPPSMQWHTGQTVGEVSHASGPSDPRQRTGNRTAAAGTAAHGWCRQSGLVRGVSPGLVGCRSRQHLLGFNSWDSTAVSRGCPLRSRPPPPPTRCRRAGSRKRWRWRRAPSCAPRAACAPPAEGDCQVGKRAAIVSC